VSFGQRAVPGYGWDEAGHAVDDVDGDLVADEHREPGQNVAELGGKEVVEPGDGGVDFRTQSRACEP
jgi:hypothetical protein